MTTPEIAVALAQSALKYETDWPIEAALGRERNADEPMRVFDISEWLDAGVSNPDAHMAWREKYGDTDRSKLGRNLPFPMFAIVLNRVALKGLNQGVFVVRGDEHGFYVYCWSSQVQTLLVTFTPDGWTTEGVIRRDGEAPAFVPGSDPQVEAYADAASLALQVVQVSCDDTKHIVSYSLNRTERRAAAKVFDTPTLNTTIIHHICLNARRKETIARQRGTSVVPTPKRLHEVRAHARRLRSGVVTRVRAHRRGTRGTVLHPRVYAVRPELLGLR